MAPSSSSRPLPWQGIWGKAARGRGLGPSFSFAPNVALVLYVPVALSLGLCFFRVKVLQKPNPQNHKNCKKKHPKLCKNHAKSTPLGSFWSDFGVILVPLGVIWRPWAPQGTPQGSRGEKVMKKLVRGSFVGPPLGPLLEPKSVTNRKKMVAKSTLKNLARKVLQKRSPRTP